MPESASEASVKILQRVNALRGLNLPPAGRTNKETPVNDHVFLSATRAAATATAAVKNMDGRKPFMICDLRFMPVVRFRFPLLFRPVQFFQPVSRPSDAIRATRFHPVHIWLISRGRNSPEKFRDFPFVPSPANPCRSIRAGIQIGR